ncbi:VOC family protein [Phenylobacterium sp.]|jgi:DNA-binding CsgD family transcriptional regulator/catechol 2,3-dioxygenase-like lactoylglutathione lyase family enzyme|uniref:VOC family protein n=1 Tax=Phenylobacterium sp. TaxID=1871053 RepID=UPI002F4237AC
MSAQRSRGRPPHADVLTPAEWQVVEAVRHGLSNPQIARRQGVSLDAVKFHVANALLKLSLPSRVELRRWDGVWNGSPLRPSAPGAAGDPDLGPVVQIARTVADIEAAKAWYGETLGLELLYAFPGMAFFRLGEARLYLQQVDKPAGESILYFRVDDIHAAYRALEARGVRFINAPHMVYRHPDGAEDWMAEFRDDEDRPLALMRHAPGQASAIRD